jgi:hypothetical protein
VLLVVMVLCALLIDAESAIYAACDKEYEKEDEDVKAPFEGLLLGKALPAHSIIAFHANVYAVAIPA